jgi:malonyl-CoA/methylmalonyl-CoA synthetase
VSPLSSPLLRYLESVSLSEQIAIIDEAGASTFRAVIERARALAEALRRAGLGGARVGLSSTPDRDWVEGFWAIVLAGGTVVPITPLHPAPERAFFLRQSGARAHLVSRSLASTLPEGPTPRLLFEAGRLLEPNAAPRAAPAPRAPDSSSALLLYTSGTTGQPKGVPLSHDNLGAGIETLAEAWGITASDRLIHALPLHHLHGICVALLTAFCAGATTQLLPRYDAEQVLEAAGHASVLMSVPTQHKRLIDYLDELPDAGRVARYTAALRGLRLITSGSAKLPERLGRRLQALSGQYPLERYGMTEVGIVLGNPLAGPRHPGSCGRPLRGCEIRIVDELGEDVAAGQPGEIWIRAGSVFSGYDADPTATASVFEAGFFKSGDTARWTPDGFVEILGRTSVDIIKSGGYKLSAIEIEEQLRAHPWVEDVAVVGVPDETWGERVVAVVVASAAGGQAVARRGPAAAEELRDWMKQRMAGYQVPKNILWWRELPRNSMGKVQKPELLRALLTES